MRLRNTFVAGSPLTIHYNVELRKRQGIKHVKFVPRQTNIHPRSLNTSRRISSEPQSLQYAAIATTKMQPFKRQTTWW